MEPPTNGTPYDHGDACKCETCHLIYDAHNLNTRTGANLSCACGGCYQRRANKTNWGFLDGAPRKQRREVRKTVATINLCERPDCGAMFKSNAAGNVSVWNEADNSGYGTIQLFLGEVCPACVGDVMALITSAPTEPRERAYDKPWKPEPPKGDTDGSPLGGLTDEELAMELVKRQGVMIARQIAPTVSDNLSVHLQDD